MGRGLIAGLLLVCAIGAQAQTVTPEDARAVRAVIEAQLDAFKRDDAARAFSYATPGIREMFGTPENFVAMVRDQYAVVYRPASVDFGKADVVDGEVVQIVVFTDREGLAWLALYPMERQADGAWRINGCMIEPLRAKPKPPLRS